jgi:hypothetical protein
MPWCTVPVLYWQQDSCATNEIAQFPVMCSHLASYISEECSVVCDVRNLKHLEICCSSSCWAMGCENILVLCVCVCVCVCACMRGGMIEFP